MVSNNQNVLASTSQARLSPDTMREYDNFYNPVVQAHSRQAQQRLWQAQQVMRRAHHLSVIAPAASPYIAANSMTQCNDRVSSAFIAAAKLFSRSSQGSVDFEDLKEINSSLADITDLLKHEGLHAGAQEAFALLVETITFVISKNAPLAA